MTLDPFVEATVQLGLAPQVVLVPCRTLLMEKRVRSTPHSFMQKNKSIVCGVALLLDICHFLRREKVNLFHTNRALNQSPATVATAMQRYPSHSSLELAILYPLVEAPFRSDNI
jgi:hypothetical protein